MRTLERITVTGYKSIKELRDFELGDINVLIGANGAGKSNFLSLFKMLDSIANNRLQLFVGVSGGADYLLFFGQKNTKEIKISLEIRNEMDLFDYELSLGAALPNRLIFLDEKVAYQPQGESRKQWIELGGGHEESQILRNDAYWGELLSGEGGSWGALLKKAVRFRPEKYLLKSLGDWKVYHFQDTTPEAKVKQNSDIYENHQLKSDGGNLASFLYLLKNHYQPFYDRILSTVRLVAPFIDNFVLQPMPENAQRIRLRWRHKNSENDFDISQLSDGTLRFICLTTLLLQPDPPSLIIIDEPELGLHPAAMGLLVEMLRSVATKSQVIISTQSVSMVNQFFPEEVIVVDREKDESVFKRLNSKELEYWLEDYSLGEIWEMNLVGGRPR